MFEQIRNRQNPDSQQPDSGDMLIAVVGFFAGLLFVLGQVHPLFG